MRDLGKLIRVEEMSEFKKAMFFSLKTERLLEKTYRDREAEAGEEPGEWIGEGLGGRMVEGGVIDGGREGGTPGGAMTG